MDQITDNDVEDNDYIGRLDDVIILLKSIDRELGTVKGILTFFTVLFILGVIIILFRACTGV